MARPHSECDIARIEAARLPPRFFEPRLDLAARFDNANKFTVYEEHEAVCEWGEPM
jgi:hypothetical protein